MLARVRGGIAGGDVISPTHNRLQPMHENGLLTPLRHDLLPNLGNLAPQFHEPVFDPRLEWGVPYMWYGTGIVYSRKLAPAPTAWADLWSERLNGRLTML